jgi:hypothetical protein
VNVNRGQVERRMGWLPVKSVYNDDFFSVVCPFCQSRAKYSYDMVRPIAPSWEQQKQAYESRISLIRAQRDRAVADAKRLAELAHQTYPTEDFEEPEQVDTTPPDSAQKQPTPPEGPNPQKRKDDKPAYLG